MYFAICQTNSGIIYINLIFLIIPTDSCNLFLNSMHVQSQQNYLKIVIMQKLPYILFNWKSMAHKSYVEVMKIPSSEWLNFGTALSSWLFILVLLKSKLEPTLYLTPWNKLSTWIVCLLWKIVYLEEILLCLEVLTLVLKIRFQSL